MGQLVHATPRAQVLEDTLSAIFHENVSRGLTISVALTSGHVGREMALSPVDVQRVPAVRAELHVLAVAARSVTVTAALRVSRQAGVLSRGALRG